jgi:uncharacterized SAM-binding protein YcdF (DUF218 family)
MFALMLAAGILVLFVVGVIRDRRSFSNAVLLGLGLALAALGAADLLAHVHDRPARLLLLALVVLVALGPLLGASYLVMNGVTMARREPLRPANLLSLAAGIGIFVVIGLALAAARTGSGELSLFSTITGLLFGYVSFLLVSYVIYAFIYGRMTAHRAADFVVVLGSGLKDGARVPTLLASRLDRGRQVYEAVTARGKASPLLIVSGGKGSDERISEAEAMAGYLIERGFPADRVVREDRSRTTEENMTFSKAIMERLRPGYRCIIVTSNYHVFRAAIIARRTGVNGQVAGARTAGYYWPSAMLREFAAVFLSYKVVNFGICALIVALPLAYAHRHGLLSGSRHAAWVRGTARPVTCCGLAGCWPARPHSAKPIRSGITAAARIRPQRRLTPPVSPAPK